jgi:predicted Zn-dependent protease
MTPRARVLAIVAVAAALAVAGTVTITWLQTRGETTSAPGSVAKPRAGTPPLLFDFGVRDDAEARSLLRAAEILRNGGAKQAASMFDRYHSVEAQIGLAFARWSDGKGLDTLKRLVSEHPASAPAQLHLGLALLWSGRNADATRQLRRVDTSFPDAPESVVAENLLYSRMGPSLPLIVTGLALPQAATAKAQLALLERAAARPDEDAKLRYGYALWTLRRRVSAEREFAAAARLAPNDPRALTLAAVGRFTKRRPVGAFGHLGPLTGRFPKASVVRFHLGVLLVWTGQVQKGKKQLRSAVQYEPGSPWGKAAKELLSALPKNGTK